MFAFCTVSVIRRRAAGVSGEEHPVTLLQRQVGIRQQGVDPRPVQHQGQDRQRGLPVAAVAQDDAQAHGPGMPHHVMHC